MNRDFILAVLDCDPDGVLVVDADGRIVFANTRAERVLQTDPESADPRRLSGSTLAWARQIASATRTPGNEAELQSAGETPGLMSVQRLNGSDNALLVMRLSDSASFVSARCAAFVRAQGLTDKDERLLVALAHDLTLKDYCTRDGLSLSKERRRLQRLYRLSGRAQLASLMIKVLTGAPGERAPTPHTSAAERQPGAVSSDDVVLTPEEGQPEEGAARPPLPSFTGLKALEAFVRLGSMTAAALELRTFPSNISRHIIKLEVATGQRLTEGRKSAIRSSEAGRTLAAAGAAAFDLVRAAAPTVTPRPRQPSSFVRSRWPEGVALDPLKMRASDEARAGRGPATAIDGVAERGASKMRSPASKEGLPSGEERADLSRSTSGTGLLAEERDGAAP